MYLEDDDVVAGISASGPGAGPERARRILGASEAAAAVRRGVLLAARDCERWSNDWPSDRGCENLIQVRAAEQLHEQLARFGLGWVTLEEPIANVSWAGTSKRGRPFLGMGDAQRADIAVWSRSDNIYGLVEIKRAEDTRGWLCDLEKLSRLLCTYGRRRGNHLRFGVLGAFVSGSSAAVARNRAARLTTLAAVVADRFGLRHRATFDATELHHFQGGGADGWTCGAASVELLAPSS